MIPASHSRQALDPLLVSLLDSPNQPRHDAHLAHTFMIAKAASQAMPAWQAVKAAIKLSFDIDAARSLRTPGVHCEGLS